MGYTYHCRSKIFWEEVMLSAWKCPSFLSWLSWSSSNAVHSTIIREVRLQFAPWQSSQIRRPLNLCNPASVQIKPEPLHVKHAFDVTPTSTCNVRAYNSACAGADARALLSFLKLLRDLWPNQGQNGLWTSLIVWVCLSFLNLVEHSPAAISLSLYTTRSLTGCLY